MGNTGTPYKDNAEPKKPDTQKSAYSKIHFHKHIVCGGELERGAAFGGTGGWGPHRTGQAF